MESAAFMEYEPNTFAAQLSTNQRKILGVIVPFITNFFLSPLFPEGSLQQNKQAIPY